MNAPKAHKNVGEGFTGAMPIRFYGPVGNGFSFDSLRTLRFSKGIPFLGSARRPIPTRPFARLVHFHGKKSRKVIARREAPWQSHRYPPSYEIASLRSQ